MTSATAITPSKLAALAEIQRRFAGLARAASACSFNAAGTSALRADERQVAAAERFAVQRCGQAVAGQRLKVCDLFCGCSAVSLGARQDGLGERVLALLLERIGRLQQLCLP